MAIERSKYKKTDFSVMQLYLEDPNNYLLSADLTGGQAEFEKPLDVNRKILNRGFGREL